MLELYFLLCLFGSCSLVADGFWSLVSSLRLTSGRLWIFTVVFGTYLGASAGSSIESVSPMSCSDSSLARPAVEACVVDVVVSDDFVVTMDGRRRLAMRKGRRDVGAVVVDVDDDGS